VLDEMWPMATPPDLGSLWGMATPVKRSRAEPAAAPRGKAATTDAVLDASERLFARLGPRAVSLRDIAREAGVTYSLINRHFGTRDGLYTALLDRYETRWAPRMQPELSRLERVEQLFGNSSDQGAYLRLLAWGLLSGEVSEHAERSVLDRLLSAPSDADDRAQVAALLALTFGWRFFQPFITAALHIDPTESKTVHDRVKDALRLIDRSRRRTETPRRD
jgi:AcrR family transcriptional regulator